MVSVADVIHKLILEENLMSKVSLNIWGRPLDLDIEYDCYEGEEILDSQKKAYELFVNCSSELFETAYFEAVNYCYKTNRADIVEDKIDNIFKYVKPKAIYIKRGTFDERKVAIICAYKFNPDDGMAIVFRNEKFWEIGSENIIL